MPTRPRRSARSFRLAATLGAALACALLSSPAAALDWDQARVTKLSVELNYHIKALLADPGLDPEQTSALQDRKHAAAIANLKSMEHASTALMDHLRAGRDRGVTEPYMVSLQDLVETVRELAARSTIGPSAAEHAEQITKAMTKLKLYYS